MNPNLKWKALFIAGVILACVYGLFGLPVFPTSWTQVKENFSRQIKLGLDLQGGTHLILQVQVQEAIAQETDQTIDHLTTALRQKNIRYDEMRRVDDTHILLRNVAPEQLAAFRDQVNDLFGGVWDLAPAAGEQSGYLLTLRPSAIAQSQQQTMQQSLDTIERRINGSRRTTAASSKSRFISAHSHFRSGRVMRSSWSNTATPSYGLRRRTMSFFRDGEVAVYISDSQPFPEEPTGPAIVSNPRWFGIARTTQACAAHRELRLDPDKSNAVVVGFGVD